MVSTTRIEGGSQVFSETVQKTIQSIKEIVGNHSDTEIYNTLKESNMDPNETTQKLLNQDPFHEVRRKRDKKKESAGNDNSTDQRRHFEVRGQGVRVNTHPDRNARRGGYSRTALPGVSREFRVVRDNRVNHDTTKEAKPASVLPATSSVENASGKGSVGSSRSEKPSGGRNSPRGSKSLTDNHIKSSQEPGSSGFIRKEASVEKHVSTPSSGSAGVQVGKGNNAHSQSATVASSSSAVGVYSSSTDPVHVPSPDSRSSGAIKREVGVVGVRRQSSDNFKSSTPGSSFANSHVRGESSTEPLRSFTNASKSNEYNQNSESVVPNTSVSRSLLGGGHYNRQPHQQTVGHQKAPQPNKEWKPKSSQKPRSPGVIGSPTKSASPSANDTKDMESDLAKVQDKVTRLGIHENQNVIIAQHIRVPETDRCQLTFGSFGKDFDPTSNLVNGFQAGVAVGESNGELAASLSVPESSVDDASCSKQVDLIDENRRPSGTDSPPSGAASENQLPERKESSSPRNLDNYADIGLVQDDTPSYDPSESQQQEPTDLPGFSAYDPSGYDIPYFRPTVDESMRGQGLQTPQEAFSHNVNSGAASTIAMVQQQQHQHQQQQQGAPNMQMYPQQVHMPHYANLMPYRQFISPVYVPPMAMPGYSSSAAYPHPSNANSYVLMPGGAAHLNANSLKYGVQQYKPVPAASPTAFGNFPNPNGYAMPMATPGGVGGAAGLEDSSRLKYKDGNLYVPNPQAETSELWMANPRDMAGMQSSAYYNMAGQSAYMPSHSAFNAAAAQSSHMQFPGVFHPPPQQSAMATHHMGPANSAPGTQVGAYQQPQLGHLNWTTNF